MKFSTAAMVLSTLAVGEAASIAHSHGIKHNHAARHAEIMKAHEEKRDLARRDLNILSALDTSNLLSLGLKAIPTNPTTANGVAWVGSDGTWTNEFFNEMDEDISIVVWGPAGSWVNAIVPSLAISVPKNSSKVVSFATGASGAWAPVHKGSSLVNGQISETWGEFTFGPYGVVDVSREVNMNGVQMKIVGPTCTSSMDQCVFVCKNNEPNCWQEYELKNCATGSQAGANFGTYAGAPSGGCGGMGESAKLRTYIGGNQYGL